MNNNQTANTNKVEEPLEANPLMAAYNPLPPQAEQPARFYWQEPWQEPSAQTFVQAAFES